MPLSSRWLSLFEELTRKFNLVTIISVAVLIASKFLILSEWASQTIRFSTVAILMIQSGIWLGLIIDYMVAQQGRAGRPEDLDKQNTYNAIRVFFKVILWIFVALGIIDNIPGVNLTSLIAGLGITGIVISLAIQNITRDLLSSVAIALDKPFVVGDFIQTDGYSGTVEAIGLRSTRIRGIDGEQQVFSNSELLSSPLKNYYDLRERRRVLRFRVAYATPPEVVARIPGQLKSIVEHIPETRFVRAYLKTYETASLLFELHYFVNSADFGIAAQKDHEINLAMLRWIHDQQISPGTISDHEDTADSG